jgi:riboflavin kinase/FMN adenylyltransferase
MHIYRQLASLPPAKAPVVATIGNFDGVHLGHQSVIAEVIARARFLGGRSLAITFDPHPACVLRPNSPFPLITPLPRKLELLADTGIDATLILPFTDVLCHMSARDFAQSILRDAIHVAEVHEGENFRFGHNAQAGVESLTELGRALGFRVTSYAPLNLRGAPISSSRIRTLIAAGRISHARALLGRPFSIDSTPAPGRGYGTRYTVPTINLAPYAELLPAHGVYVTTLTIAAEAPGPPSPPAPVPPQNAVILSDAERSEGESKDPRISLEAEQAFTHSVTFPAVTNIGVRPTFGADSFAVESHLLDFRPIALDERTPLRLTFLRRLRDEQRFPTPEALRAQISLDVSRARRLFSLCPTLS